MVLIVIISITIPVCANANDFSYDEWESVSQSIADESRRIEQEAEEKQDETDEFSEMFDEVNSYMEQAREQQDEVKEKQDEMDEISDKIFDTANSVFKMQTIIVPIVFVLFIIFAVVIIVVNIKLHKKAAEDNKSAKTTFVPFEPVSSDNETHISQNTQKKVEGKCMYCGKEILPENKFCSHCGKKQTEEYVKIFNRDNMDNSEFIASINSWLANNPKIANVKCEFNKRTGYGILVNEFFLDSVALKYELFENDNENQYAIVEIKNFGYYRKSTDSLLAEWQEHNPDAVILKRSGGTHSRGQEGYELDSGIGADNNTQLFVFFKFKRK